MKSTFNEKREHLRSASKPLVGVSFSVHGMDQDLAGMLNDFGPDGIGISTAEVIPPQTMIDISIFEQKEDESWTTKSFLGEVRWCKQSDLIEDTFSLGIKSHHIKRLH